MVTFKLAVLLVAVVTVHGWARHTYDIPNGAVIPDPCNPLEFSLRLGAINSGHAGGQDMLGLNQFGVDFKAAGMAWTRDFCKMDSDGDGMPNGVELGDANCKWNKNDSAPGPVKGPPGVCEPIWSVNCRANNPWMTVENCPPLGKPHTTPSKTPRPTTPTPTPRPPKPPSPPCGEAPNNGYLMECKKCKGKKNGWYKCDRYTKGKKCCCLDHKPAKCPPCKVGEMCGGDLMGEIMSCNCCKTNLGWYKCPKFNPDKKSLCCCIDEKPPNKACKLP